MQRIYFDFTTSLRFIFAFVLCWSFSITANAQKKAQVTRTNVEIYGAPNFDADVIETIQPGEFYPISSKPSGPFYKIKLKNGKIGYVSDTELDIQGEGVFEPKPYVEDEEELAKAKKASKKKKTEKAPEPEEEEEDSDILQSLHGVSLQIINYHEDTMGGIQVGDLFAVGYKYIPLQNEYSTSVGYDIFAAFTAPKYYEERTGRTTKGLAVWGGAQILNMSVLSYRSTFRYGAGPFLKYTNFQTETSTQKYTLQDMTIGVDIQAGVIFSFKKISFDVGLRYFWDKEPYGAFGLTFLF